MVWYDWLLIAIIFVGMIVRIIGRIIRIHVMKKHVDHPEDREIQLYRAKTIIRTGTIIALVPLLIVFVLFLINK